MAGQTKLDLCGNHIRIDELRLDADCLDLVLVGQLMSELLVCERVDVSDYTGGATRSALVLRIVASASVNLKNKCVVFTCVCLTVEPTEMACETNETLKTARGLLLFAATLMLDACRSCPELPAGLRSLDPIYDSADPERPVLEV